VDSKAECDQLNLAHVTKTNKRQCPLSSVQIRSLLVQRNERRLARTGKHARTGDRAVLYLED